MDNQNFQDFGISTGKRRACTYYTTKNQDTCGGATNVEDPSTLKGQSLNKQRAETLMTVTGYIRGSFVSTYKLQCTVVVLINELLTKKEILAS